MHELPVVTRILDLALGAAPPGARILRVDLAVGALCDAEPRWLERYFRLAARGTACAGAELRLSRLAAGFRCAACGALFLPAALAAPGDEPLSGPALAARLADAPAPIRCPACGSAEVGLEGGLEYRLESIEVAEGGEA